MPRPEANGAVIGGTRHGELIGVHFVNLTVRRTPDPIKPNVLIYEPVS